MARALMSALHYGDHHVTIASTLRSREPKGSETAQKALIAQAAAEIDTCLALPAVRAAQVWLTYHNYYKAPDLVGPVVSRTLGIPYVQIESTRARKRLDGPWANFAARSEDAAESADTIIYLTAHDEVALRAYAPALQKLRHLPPFLNRTTLPKLGHRNGSILSVGMMRYGDKLRSYQIIAETLQKTPGEWHINIAGDGEARKEVEALMAPVADRVTYLGALSSENLAAQYADAAVLFWPGVNEAYGMTYLEARAAGLPVVAQDRPGVRDVAGPHLTAQDKGADGLAQQLRIWLDNPNIRIAAGDTARQEIAKTHLLPAASARLSEKLEEVT